MWEQQHSFSTHERMLLWKCQSFWDRKCLDLRGTRTPKPQIFGFMPNSLTIWVIRVTHLLSHVFEYWLWRYRYFWSKVDIWNVNCARATAFIFDTLTDVVVKVSKVLRQKMSRRERTSNYTHYKMWNETTYPLPNFNSPTVEFGEWICDFNRHFAEYVITYPCLG